MKVEIHRGQVQVSSVYAVIDTPDFKVINVDADTKRYHINDWTSETVNAKKGTLKQENVFELTPVEDSLHLDESTDENTQIVFIHDEDGRWDVMTDSYYVRYGFRIVLMKRVERIITTLWEDEDDS